MKVSARNVFAGTIAGVKKGAVNAEVIINLRDKISIAAIITNASVDNLDLADGKEAYAFVKASNVIIGTDVHNARLSARNIMCGKIVKLIEGPVSTEVSVKIGDGINITAVITHESSRRLGLKEGEHACTLFKASSVIVGVK
jgi:molybdate transport system regulatory protein